MATIQLCHFDGSNGATTVSDEVPGATWDIASYDGALTTSTYQFASASLSGAFGAGGQCTGFTCLASGNWTLEGWFRSGGSVDGMTLRGTTSGLVERAWICLRPGTGEVTWGVRDSAGTMVYAIAVSASISSGVWYHMALVRSGTTYSLYLNGIRVDSFVDATNTSSLQGLVIQAGGSGDMIDEVRTSDEARYTGSTYTVPTSEFTLGPTVNIDSKTAEFGREVDTPIVSRWLTPNSAEFDSEIGDVGAVFTQADLQSEYDYESGSPAVSLVYVVGTSTYERGWEISLTQDAVPGSMEFGWEGKSTGIPTDYFIGSNRTPMERDWESSSPGLSSRGFLRGVTPIRRRIIAGRASIDRRTDPQYRVDIDPSRRTEIVRVLR